MSMQNFRAGLYDEYGLPYIILAAEKNKKIIKGQDVIKSNIRAVKNVCDILRTSLGPKGMDKMVIDEDLNIIVTNDGATILENMDIDHEMAKIMVQLSKSQDKEIGDGTTSVVVLAGALLTESESLLQKGIHSSVISDGFEKAAKCCVEHLQQISQYLPINNPEPLIQAAMTALSSKIVSKCNRKLAELSVKAVRSITHFASKTIDLNRIKLIGINGGSLEDTTLIEGVVLCRKFSHPQMPKILKKADIALVMNAIEMPKVKTKIVLNVNSAQSYHHVCEYEENQLKKIIRQLKNIGVTVLVCLNRIDENVKHMLLQNGIAGIQRATISELESLSQATGAKIVGRIDNDLTSEKLGYAGSVKELNFGTNNDSYIIFEDCQTPGNSTILIRSPNPIVLAEAKRSIHDALCVVRNIILDGRIVYGGGASEISCAIQLNRHALHYSSVIQYCVQAFANALQSIPIALAENCGFSAYDVLSEVRAHQINEQKPIYGIDCMSVGTDDMKHQNVIDTFAGKRQIILMATDVVKMILKIDQVRVLDKNYGEYERQ